MFSLRAEWGAPLPPLQLVGPDAQAGAVEVMVSESKGLEQPFTLTLTAARDDVAITFEHDSFYPPVIDENALLHFEFTAPQGEHFDLTFRVNGDNNTAGIYIFSEDALLFTNEFMNSYQGPWPAKFELVAIQNGDIVATATLNLLDVRKVVVDSLYIIPLPSDQVTIPTEGKLSSWQPPGFSTRRVYRYLLLKCTGSCGC
ncbi:hypothetical protein [Pseudomonas sp. Irchel 3E13]|uniref:hypothetical protein n=1 Tax=Pseudomonas sp. Irchel 3E13 TaxID=2008975 RepID=UPI001179A991|nr:hypothetical protein [Pseudomonas sp. Irchel 3E13]